MLVVLMQKAYKILVILMILSYAILIFYSNSVNMENLSKIESFFLSFLAIIRNISIFLIFSIFIIWSIYNYKIAKNRILANTFLFISLLLPLFILYVSYEVETIIDNDNKKSTELKCVDYIIKDNSNKENAKKFASMCYIKKGISINLIESNGLISKYIPTKKDESLRDETLKVEKLKKETKDLIKNIYIFCSSLLIISILIGLLSLKYRQHIILYF